MKDELQTKLVEILTSIQNAAGKAGDFAMTQLPDIAQQYVAYGRAYTVAFAIVGLAIFCLGFWAMHLVNKRVRAADKRFEEDLAAWRHRKEEETKRAGYFYESEPYRHRYFESMDVAPIQYAPFLIGAVIFFLNLSGLLLVWFAPKVWLLKEIATLLK